MSIASARALLFALCLLGSPLNPAQASEPRPQLTGQALIEALRQGGHNIYFRHEATDWTQDDFVTQPEDWLSCDGSKIRQLSDQGRTNARQTGAAMRKLKIPVSRVLASPYCRTMETARLMGLGEVEASTAVINMRVERFFGGQSAIVATAQALLATPPDQGTNTVIVAHGNVARMATPIYPDEGEGIVFQPDDREGFIFIGRLTSADWQILAKSVEN